MARCIVCGNPLTSETRLRVSVVTESGCPSCSQPCIHEWIENLSRLLCSVCKAAVGGNRFTPISGSENNIDDNRDNTPSGDERIGRDLYNAIIHNLGFDWTYVSIFIIFIVLLCLIVYIIIG